MKLFTDREVLTFATNAVFSKGYVEGVEVKITKSLGLETQLRVDYNKVPFFTKTIIYNEFHETCTDVIALIHDAIDSLKNKSPYTININKTVQYRESKEKENIAISNAIVDRVKKFNGVILEQLSLLGAKSISISPLDNIARIKFSVDNVYYTYDIDLLSFIGDHVATLEKFKNDLHVVIN